MNKPLDVILASLAQQRDQDALTADAMQLVDVAGRLSAQWTQLFNEASTLARRRGLNALLATVTQIKGAACATALQELLAAAATFQATVTDLPSPEFPAEAQPETPTPEAAE